MKPYAEQLDFLSKEICRRQREIIEHERRAIETFDVDHLADMARLELARLKDRYIEVSEASRRAVCIEHGEAVFAACPHCCAANDLTKPAEVIPLSTSMAQSSAILDEAKRIGVEGWKAMRIARVAIGLLRRTA